MNRCLAAAPEHKARNGPAGQATPTQPRGERPGGRFAVLRRRGEVVTAWHVRRLMETEAV